MSAAMREAVSTRGEVAAPTRRRERERRVKTWGR